MFKLDSTSSSFQSGNYFREFVFALRISLDVGSCNAIMHSLPMLTTNETSLTRAADPVYVGIGSTLHTSAGSVAFGGLEKGRESRVEQPSIAKSYCPNIAEPVKDSAPMADGSGTPTNWFELAADLCASGHITETRMRRAIDAVRQGVKRG